MSQDEMRRLFDFLPLSSREQPPSRPFFDDPSRIESRLLDLEDDIVAACLMAHAGVPQHPLAQALSRALAQHRDAVLREEEAIAGRGILAAPSAQKT